MEEKKGGVRALINITASFYKLIEEPQLVDVQTTNGLFTLQNKFLGARHIASRLDRFLVSQSAMVGGGKIRETMLPAVGFDH